MDFDVIVVGGSFAGLAAAMQLVRARRRVVVIDAGQPRNRFTPASHGFLGQDGVAPGLIRQRAMDQLMRYPDFTLLNDQVAATAPEGDGFAATLASGVVVTAARLILAGGISDALPDIQGIEPLWGRSVLHCPYCHGFELGGAPIGIHLRMKPAIHQALILPDWGKTTLFLASGMELDADERQRLANRGVEIETAEIVELLADGDRLRAARLSDGRLHGMAGLFIQPQTTVNGPFVRDLELETEEGPSGAYIRVDQIGATSRPGVFAAGDAVTAMHNATLAAASGVRAAAGTHFSLVQAEAAGQPRLCARA